MIGSAPSSLFRRVAIGALLLSACAGVNAADAQTAAAEQKAQGEDADNIAFSSDIIDFDSVSDVVTAKGNVVVRREGYTLRADTVVWNRKSGEVTANGNIRSIGPRGDVAYGSNITLTDTLKDGVVENLLLVLKDGSRLAANRGTRTDGRLTLEQAAYTPCAVEGPRWLPKRP